ncbi:MAG: hypothetical protein WCC10_15990 [Tumebacillaceae bacterium]
MDYTMVPIVQGDPLTFGAEHVPLDGAEADAWRKAVQALHPRLLPNLKESALLSEEDSEFCVMGGIFEYQRGQELQMDSVQYLLSHCAEHFVDFLLPPPQCLQITNDKQAELAMINGTAERQQWWDALVAWWSSGYRVLLIQHT